MKEEKTKKKKNRIIFYSLGTETTLLSYNYSFLFVYSFFA